MFDMQRLGSLLWDGFRQLDGKLLSDRRSGSFEWERREGQPCLSDGYQRELVVRGLKFTLSKFEIGQIVSVFYVYIVGEPEVLVYRDSWRGILVPECAPVLEDMHKQLEESRAANEARGRDYQRARDQERATLKNATVRNWERQRGSRDS